MKEAPIRTLSFKRLPGRWLLAVVFGWSAFAGFIAPPSASSEYFDDYSGLPRNIDIILGESKVLPVSNPKRIAIGDPKVADVVGAGMTEIIISAKKAGETNLQIWDDLGQREISVRVFEEDLQRLKDRLEDLFRMAGVRGINFQIGEQERKVFALGDVPLRKQSVVDQLLESFEGRVINLVAYTEDSPVVEIDVQIMEIAKKAIDRLGIDWSPSITFSETNVVPHTMIPRHFPDMLKAIGQARFDRDALTATLHLLERDNLLHILARPKLVAVSGAEAKFLVGGEVPILGSVSNSSDITTTDVEYEEYGIKLNIKPEVMDNGDVRCQLEVEIRTIDTSTALSIQTGPAVTTSTPGFKVRNVSSELYLKDKDTVFLAGLIDSAQTNNLAQVPGLGNLPVFGALFRSKDFVAGANELVISLTPKVVRFGDLRDEVPGAQITQQQLDEDPAEAYSRAVQEIILKNAGYPLEAQRANLSGEVVLSLHLLSSGQLVNVVVSQSSGHKMLDSAAVFSVKRMSPYPAFPKGLLLKEIWVEAPITYQMN